MTIWPTNSYIKFCLIHLQSGFCQQQQNYSGVLLYLCHKTFNEVRDLSLVILDTTIYLPHLLLCILSFLCSYTYIHIICMGYGAGGGALPDMCARCPGARGARGRVCIYWARHCSAFLYAAGCGFWLWVLVMMFVWWFS